MTIIKETERQKRECCRCIVFPPVGPLHVLATRIWNTTYPPQNTAISFTFVQRTLYNNKKVSFKLHYLKVYHWNQKWCLQPNTNPRTQNLLVTCMAAFLPKKKSIKVFFRLVYKALLIPKGETHLPPYHIKQHTT